MQQSTAFTLPSLASSDRSSWVPFFQEHGYVVLDGIYNEEELADIESFFEEYRKDAVLEGGVDPETRHWRRSKFEDVDRKKQQVRALHPHRFSEKIKGYFLHPKVGEALQAIFEKPALGAQTMYYYKPPGSRGQGMHQDNFYLLAEPASCAAVWTPLDETDVENGCLYVVPGSHKMDLLCPETDKRDRWLNYGDSHIDKFPRGQQPIPVSMKRGQTLIFHGRTIHGSGPNRTPDRWRRTFIGHYVDEATASIADFYHPVLDFQGETASSIKVHAGGGPCGDGWQGAVH